MPTQTKLFDQVAEMRRHLSNHATMTSSISKWSVMQQIEHICLVANGIFWSLLQSKGDKIADKNLKKLAFFKTRFIPRGAVKAPDFVSPKPDSTLQTVQNLIDTFEKNIDTVALAPESKTRNIHY